MSFKLSKILLEYRSTKGVEQYLQNLKKNPNQEALVAWNDGDIIVNPTAQDSMQMSIKAFTRNTIGMKLKPSKKLVTIVDYDDWSSFKAVPRMQQAIKDLVRLKLIHPTYKIQVGISDAVKNLGKGTVQAFLDYDSSYSSNIPRAFHGTTEYDLESIKKIGITPPSKNPNAIIKWEEFYTEGSPDTVYLSTDYDRAAYYARHAKDLYKRKGIKTKPIVLQIDNLPIDRVVADDDFRSNMSMVQFLAAVRSDKKVDPNSYIASIRGTAQFGYKARIPPSMITKVHNVK